MIELSIVLIIIGLLVAGITGGQSLIESAKIRAFINELNGYKQAVAIFYANNYRYPGDLNDDGYIGRCDAGTGCVSEKYTASSFPAPYNVSVSGDSYGQRGPFIELYLDNLIDFQPVAGRGGAGNSQPYSKVFSTGYYSFYSYGVVSLSSTSTSFYKKMKNASPYLNFYNNKDNDKQTKLFKTIDEKIDDGKYNDGNVRAYNCRSDVDGSYEPSTENNVKLTDLYYNVGIR